jgi:microcystin-dependent protein
MSEPFLGEIRVFGGNFAPKGWMLCNGAILPISQFSALFSILGTTYGGNGQTNFGLPNLQGNAPMSWGNGPGLTPRTIGEVGGSANVTLLPTELPSHTHTGMASGSDGTLNTPVVLAEAPIYGPNPATGSGQIVAMAAAVAPTGGSQPHNNMAPYLGMTFIIALQGIFPSRG